MVLLIKFNDMTSKSVVPFSSKSGNVQLQKRSNVDKKSNNNIIQPGKENRDATYTARQCAQKRQRKDSFDFPPKSPSPPYKYRRDSVRNKQKRRELPGQECDGCATFYAGLGLNEKELQELKDKCSRHRDKYPIRSNSPIGIWNPRWSSSDDSD